MPFEVAHDIPVFFIKRKDGSLHLVQDYRKLNAMTIKNEDPLPLIPDILDKVSEARPSISQSWTFIEDTTMCVLKKEMSGKLPSA